MKKYRLGSTGHVGWFDDEQPEFIIDAEDVVDAYIKFVEQILGIELSCGQRDEALRQLCVGCKLFDFIECTEE